MNRAVASRRIKLLALFGLILLSWWFYAAPAQVAKRIRDAVAQSPQSSLVRDRVDFSSVNAQLSGDLRTAAAGKPLNSESFSHLLFHGWLPQQKASTEPTPGGLPLYTRLYHVRYKSLNRTMVTFWDTYEYHQIILTLQRKSVFHPWKVTKVFQYNLCKYDFDCKQVVISDLPAKAN